jgi:hypothetical protein
MNIDTSAGCRITWILAPCEIRTGFGFITLEWLSQSATYLETVGFTGRPTPSEAVPPMGSANRADMMLDDRFSVVLQTDGYLIDFFSYHLRIR